MDSPAPRYLDHAATSPVRPEVVAAMAPFLLPGGVFGNPSSVHAEGQQAAAALEDARSRVARVLGVRAGDVIFTSGGTEANNLAVKGIALGALPGGGRRVLTTPIEHDSILASADYLRRLHGMTIDLLPVSETGRIDPADVRDSLREDTALLSIGHANNEIGTVQDVAGIVSVARERRVPVHVDAVQSAGWLPLGEIGADAISIAGHKLGAPQGTGALAVRGRVPLEPLFHGGGQERGLRSGTENVAGAVALATALELAEAERADASATVGAFTDAFLWAMLAQVPGSTLRGDPAHRLPGTVSVTFDGVNGETVLLELERRGVISSSGSACAAGSQEPSPVLLACGVSPELARSAVRFTFARHRPEGSAPALAALVAEAVAAAKG